MIFQVNPVNIKTSVVNHIGDRAVAARIPIGVEFERRFAEGLSDHPLNVCKREGNAVLRLLGKVLAQRGKAGIHGHIPLLGRFCGSGGFVLRLGGQFHQPDEVEINVNTLSRAYC